MGSNFGIPSPSNCHCRSHVGPNFRPHGRISFRTDAFFDNKKKEYENIFFFLVGCVFA